MLRIFNSLSGKKEEFVPVRQGAVGMYACGVTVYDLPHLGHARGAVVFDIIRRYLRRKGFRVKYVRNFTDIDDKIISRAEREGITAAEVADKYINAYIEDMNRLGVDKPDVEPRATEHIKEIIEVVSGLIVKRYAYRAEGDVFFRVAGCKDYGKLSKRRKEDVKAGARVGIDIRKTDPLDFALWKASKPGEPAWDSPWGAGRPGWHIECTAMCFKHLGSTLDIHAGGRDLIFPHHENEIAQSEAFSGKKFVNYWIHNGFVTNNREKMSKSLGNFFTVREILDRYDPEIVRLFLLSTHYRSPIDFSTRSLEDTRAGLDRFYRLKLRIQRILSGSVQAASTAEAALDITDRPLYEKILNLSSRFEEAMDDDFNTAFAIGSVFDLVGDVNKFMSSVSGKDPRTVKIILSAVVASFENVGGTLGLFLRDPAAWFTTGAAADNERIPPDRIEDLILMRNNARTCNDWIKADQIRKTLDEHGVTVSDTPEGTVWKPKYAAPPNNEQRR